MVRHLMISLGCLLVAIIGTVMIIEGVVYGDERERQQIGAAERARVARLMDYHGTSVAYERDGAWWFDRAGKRCRLEAQEPEKGATHDAVHH